MNDGGNIYASAYDNNRYERGSETKWSDLNILFYFVVVAVRTFCAFSEDLMRAFHANGKE